MQKEPIPKFWRVAYVVSSIVSPSSFVLLRLLNDKSFMPWLESKYLPWYGVPLSIIFFLSSLLGGKALLELINKSWDRYKELLEIEKKYHQEGKD